MIHPGFETDCGHHQKSINRDISGPTKSIDVVKILFPRKKDQLNTLTSTWFSANKALSFHSRCDFVRNSKKKRQVKLTYFHMVFSQQSSVVSQSMGFPPKFQKKRQVQHTYFHNVFSQQSSVVSQSMGFPPKSHT